MVMVANKKNSAQMADDLSLFLGTNTAKFTTWYSQHNARILWSSKPENVGLFTVFYSILGCRVFLRSWELLLLVSHNLLYILGYQIFGQWNVNLLLVDILTWYLGSQATYIFFLNLSFCRTWILQKSAPVWHKCCSWKRSIVCQWREQSIRVEETDSVQLTLGQDWSAHIQLCPWKQVPTINSYIYSSIISIYFCVIQKYS